MRLFWILTLLTASLAACRNSAAENESVKKTAPGSTTNSTDIQINSSNQAAVAAVATKTGRGTGLVTKINLQIGSVELKHEEIKGMMPAMQMEFYVSEKKELEPLKIGDRVVFTLEDNQGAERIIKIAKTE